MRIDAPIGHAKTMSHGSGATSRPEGWQTDTVYALARSQEEYERLARQAAFLNGTTERLFRAAGLRPGMRVLDVGSGSGDVAFLVADLVGPEGAVVGVDVDAAALEVARARAESLGLHNVTFADADVRTDVFDEGLDAHDCFDAAVGRLILMYLTDPTEGIRRIAARVRPGGVIAFQEIDADPAIGSRSLPDTTLWNQTGRLITDTFSRAGVHVRMGRQLFGAFVAAGLPAPTMCDEALVGGGPEFAGYAWIAGIARALSPAIAKLAIADPDKLGFDTLADRLRDEALAAGAVVWTPSFVGAYARKPEA
jgi:ubiquinone/menaquinone biosynthesis C-methylase UbiE